MTLIEHPTQEPSTAEQDDGSPVDPSTMPDLGFGSLYRSARRIEDIPAATASALELLAGVDPRDAPAVAVQAQRAIHALRAELWKPHAHIRNLAVLLALAPFEEAAAACKKAEDALTARRDAGDLGHLAYQREVSKVRAVKRDALAAPPGGRKPPRPHDVEEALGIVRTGLRQIRRDAAADMSAAPAALREATPWQCLDVARAETPWFPLLEAAQTPLREVRDPALERLWMPPPDGYGMGDRAIGRLIGVTHPAIIDLRHRRGMLRG